MKKILILSDFPNFQIFKTIKASLKFLQTGAEKLQGSIYQNSANISSSETIMAWKPCFCMGNAFFQVDTFILKEWKTLASKMHPEGRVPQPQVSASWDHNVDGKFNPSLENFFSTSSQVSAFLSNVIVCVHLCM